MKTPSPERRAYTLSEVAGMFRIGRSTAYTLAKQGGIKTTMIGGRFRVTAEEVERIAREGTWVPE